MGYYINEDSNGKPLGSSFTEKVNSLKKDGAEVVDAAVFQDNLICVVANHLFAAAGYCFDEREFEDFKHPDGRRKIWLTHPQAKELSGYK